MSDIQLHQGQTTSNSSPLTSEPTTIKITCLESRLTRIAIIRATVKSLNHASARLCWPRWLVFKRAAYGLINRG